MISKEGYLYIEPSGNVSETPIIDNLTRKMAAAFFQAKEGPGYRGFHVCECGVYSTNRDYQLPNGQWTNSLCVHYLAWHRYEVPVEELEKVGLPPYGEAEPDSELLRSPYKQK